MQKIKKIVISILFFMLILGLFSSFFPKLVLNGINVVNRWYSSVKKYEIQVGNYNWHYLEGEQGETIVFLHGFGSNKDQWSGLLRAFSKKNNVISPDLPGFGETGYFENHNYGIAEQVERLNEFIEKKGLKSFHILGVSMGGAIAGGYAAKYPVKIKTLFLMDPFGVETEIESDFKKNATIEDKILVYKNNEEFSRFLGYILFNPPWLPGFAKSMAVKVQMDKYQSNGKILIDIKNSGEDYLEKQLEKIEARTLVIWGKNDRIFHYSAAEKLKDKIKENKVYVFEECGHVPYIEKEKETVEAYQKFLNN